MLAIRLPEDLEKRLEALSKRTGRTKTYHVREAIVEHVDHLEGLYRAKARLEAPRRGDDQAVPIGEVTRGHGDDGVSVVFVLKVGPRRNVYR